MKVMRTVILASVCVIAGACATSSSNGTMNGMDTSYWANATSASDTVAIMTTANESEVQQGNAALSKATSAQVREFAQMMVTEHTNGAQMVRDAASRMNVTPTDNATTSALRSGTQMTITNLNTYSGAAFDRMYMRTQVDVHQWLLNALDTALIPSARTADLRTLLQNQRASVAAHLDRARQIAGGL